MLLDPPSLTNCHTFSDPSPLSVTHFMEGPYNAPSPKTFTNSTNYASSSSSWSFSTLVTTHLKFSNRAVSI